MPMDEAAGRRWQIPAASEWTEGGGRNQQIEGNNRWHTDKIRHVDDDSTVEKDEKCDDAMSETGREQDNIYLLSTVRRTHFM